MGAEEVPIPSGRPGYRSAAAVLNDAARCRNEPCRCGVARRPGHCWWRSSQQCCRSRRAPSTRAAVNASLPTSWTCPSYETRRKQQPPPLYRDVKTSRPSSASGECDAEPLASGRASFSLPRSDAVGLPSRFCHVFRLTLTSSRSDGRAEGRTRNTCRYVRLVAWLRSSVYGSRAGAGWCQVAWPGSSGDGVERRPARGRGFC